MKNPILVLGAGRSATVLLDYIQNWAAEENFRFTVADVDADLLQSKIAQLPQADALVFQATEVADLAKLIDGHSVAISLLPPPMHPLVAKACIQTKTDLVTASYESEEMRALRPEIDEAGITIFNECGLDPGIDHMSAMEVIHDVQAKGGKIVKFHSYCGGLVADECDDNPFKYKISWNPRNVVMAGKGTAKYLESGRETLMPYHRLFDSKAQIRVPEWGTFEGYANRDSVPYAALYGISDVQSLLRGTLRKPGFCERWQTFVQLGLTDDQTVLHFTEGSTYEDLLLTFLPGEKGSLETRLQSFPKNGIGKNEWADLGFIGNNATALKRQNGTPADYLQDLIVEKWALKSNDKDLVVMVHDFEWTLENTSYQTIASFGIVGDDSVRTAMAKTVGLPLGIIAKALFHNLIEKKGLVLPLTTNTYTFILKELSNFGIQFQVSTQPLS